MAISGVPDQRSWVASRMAVVDLRSPSGLDSWTSFAATETGLPLLCRSLEPHCFLQLQTRQAAEEQHFQP